MTRYAEPMMGTVFSFDLRDPDDLTIGSVVEWLHWVDATFSTYRRASDISRLGRGELRLDECAPAVARVLDLCAEAARRTEGYFTALPGGTLDPSGLVKGWAVEEASRQLVAAGSQRHSVAGGGDVQTVGGPFRIGIADPRDPQQLISVVTVAGAAVATSGTAERGHHIVNPLTGQPAGELVSLTVVGPSLLWADVYATAGFARGQSARDWLERLDDYEAFAVTADGGAWWTSGFPDHGTVPHSVLSGNRQAVVSTMAEG